VKPYYESDLATVYCADVLEALRELPDESVQCCVTSPPYWGLRDYGVEGQIGLEPDLQDYIAKMVEVFAEVRRVLRGDGTLWLNLGDCYSAHPGQRGIEDNAGAKQVSNHGSVGAPSRSVASLKPKDLVGLPWRVAFALQEDGYYLRSDIIWQKPNPMPESVTDRPTRAHEYIFLLTKAAQYFYDAEAIREPSTQPDRVREDSVGGASWKKRGQHSEGGVFRGSQDKQRGHERRHAGFNDRWDAMSKKEQGASGRNKRDVWSIATHPYPEAHFATFPEKLIEPCVKAGTSERGCCAECGVPWIRQTEKHRHFCSGSGRSGNLPVGKNGPNLQGGGETKDVRRGPTLSVETLGWQPSCGCGASMEPDDLEMIESPTGEVTAEDPSRRTGRAGMNRPRGPDEGKRLITRWQQRRIAEQLRASPYRAEMESMVGSNFSHYIRTDRAGARPPAPDLLEKWIACGWVTMPEMPEGRPSQPVPCTVLDPFGGSMTSGVVALKLGRRFIGIELNQSYLDDFGLDRLRAAEQGLTVKEVRAGQQGLF